MNIEYREEVLIYQTWDAHTFVLQVLLSMINDQVYRFFKGAYRKIQRNRFWSRKSIQILLTYWIVLRTSKLNDAENPLGKSDLGSPNVAKFSWWFSFIYFDVNRSIHPSHEVIPITIFFPRNEVNRRTHFWSPLHCRACTKNAGLQIVAASVALASIPSHRSLAKASALPYPPALVAWGGRYSV